MIPFAVHLEGMEEGKGRWVLAVDRESVLLADDDGKLSWHPLADCTLIQLKNPVAPQPVVLVQQRTELVTPNRVQRRALERNGPE